MKKIENPPYAPNLVDSMRSIGYSFETALADIVDNSISAEATKVFIDVRADDYNCYLSILDNGFGMNSSELYTAMKYGSSSVKRKRNLKDLGRFGLGLKSASLSQCKKLTVISKKDNIFSCLVWDIDFVKENKSWVMQELSDDEMKESPNFNKLSNLDSGTLVIWQNFDRLTESSKNINESLLRKVKEAEGHLALIYHRILSKNFSIYINNESISPLDPFLENHPGTQKKRDQKFKIDNETILVKPFILPHMNKLSVSDIKQVGGKENLRTSQGFYIYRNKRLIVWGTWFRMGFKNELTKLARIRVDIPNTLDEIWDLDIKKSQATVPEKIKVHLYNAVIESCDISKTVNEFSGKKLLKNDVYHSWQVLKKRDSIDLKVNLEHPLIHAFYETLDNKQKNVFSNVITNLETQIPIEYIYSQVANGTKINDVQSAEKINELDERIQNGISLGFEKKVLIQMLLHDEMYYQDKSCVEYLNKLLEEE